MTATTTIVIITTVIAIVTTGTVFEMIGVLHIALYVQFFNIIAALPGMEFTCKLML